MATAEIHEDRRMQSVLNPASDIAPPEFRTRFHRKTGVMKLGRVGVRARSDKYAA